MKVLA